MDLLGPFENTARGNTLILVIADRLTEMTRFKPLQNATANTATADFLEYRAYAYGAHRYILTDNG